VVEKDASVFMGFRVKDEAVRRGRLAGAGCRLGVWATVIVTSLHVGLLKSN